MPVLERRENEENKLSSEKVSKEKTHSTTKKCSRLLPVKICATRVIYDDKTCKKACVKQVASSRSLGGELPPDKKERIAEIGQAFTEQVKKIISEHVNIKDMVHFALSSTFVAYTENETTSENCVEPDFDDHSNWIATLTKGREDALQDILIQATEDVPEMPIGKIREMRQEADKVQSQILSPATPFLPTVSSVEEQDICVHCRASLKDATAIDYGRVIGEHQQQQVLWCANCRSKWCNACSAPVRDSGQCACCFLCDTLEIKDLPMTYDTDIRSYYTKARKPGGEITTPEFPSITTATLATSPSDTESDEEMRHSSSMIPPAPTTTDMNIWNGHGVNSGYIINNMSQQHEPTKKKTKQETRTTNRVMKHGDAIGIWRRRFQCCGSQQPFETEILPTCKRRTWLGNLNRALEHVKEKHGMKDIRWKRTDDYWICLTGRCGEGGDLPSLHHHSMEHRFSIHIPKKWTQQPMTKHDKGKKESSNDNAREWERIAFTHMQMVHGVKQLTPREKAMPHESRSPKEGHKRASNQNRDKISQQVEYDTCSTTHHYQTKKARFDEPRESPRSTVTPHTATNTVISAPSHTVSHAHHPTPQRNAPPSHQQQPVYYPVGYHPHYIQQQYPPPMPGHPYPSPTYDARGAQSPQMIPHQYPTYPYPITTPYHYPHPPPYHSTEQRTTPTFSPLPIIATNESDAAVTHASKEKTYVRNGENGIISPVSKIIRDTDISLLSDFGTAVHLEDDKT